MISEKYAQFFLEEGYVVIPGFESAGNCEEMKLELELAMAEDGRNHPHVFDSGMVHNCFMRGVAMLRHLESASLRFATDELLCKNAIVYAYQSSSLPPGGQNYGSRIHVDSPRFVEGYRTNLGYILALDSFTRVNGATFVLPKSHTSPEKPSGDYFESNAIQLTCEVGDAIFFDGRLYHKAGVNQTDNWRHSITINFCRPYMRTRFDFPRLIETSKKRLQIVNPSARKFLGFDVRMPTSLDEFYLPEDQRLYRPNQE